MLCTKVMLVFTNDGLDLYFYATFAPARSAGVTAHFGQWITDVASGKLRWQAGVLHFCHPHLSLRLQLDVPLARRGKQTPRRYGPRTSAMAAGLTDHLWSVEELLAFPVGL